MIQIGIHTDNWRPLSQSFETACGKIAALGVRHIEFAVIHGQNFIQALGYDPAISLQANPRALRKYLDGLNLEASQIDGSYPMMGPNGSAFGVQYVQQTIRFAAEIGCPMVDTVDGASETPGMSFEEVFRVTCDNYRQCLSWAEDYGVVINVETHGPYTSNVDFMTRLFELFRLALSAVQLGHGQHVHRRQGSAGVLQGPAQVLVPLSHQGRLAGAGGGGARRRDGHRLLGGARRRRRERREHQGRHPLSAGDRLGRRRFDRVPRLRREHPQEPGVHAENRGPLIAHECHCWLAQQCRIIAMRNTAGQASSGTLNNRKLPFG